MNNAKLLAKGNKFVEHLHFPPVLRLQFPSVGFVPLVLYISKTTRFSKHDVLLRPHDHRHGGLFNRIYLDKLSIREVLCTNLAATPLRTQRSRPIFLQETGKITRKNPNDWRRKNSGKRNEVSKLQYMAFTAEEVSVSKTLAQLTISMVGWQMFQKSKGLTGWFYSNEHVFLELHVFSSR